MNDQSSETQQSNVQLKTIFGGSYFRCCSLTLTYAHTLTWTSLIGISKVVEVCVYVSWWPIEVYVHSCKCHVCALRVHGLGWCCAHTLHSICPRRPAHTGSFNRSCWKALGRDVTNFEPFPGLSDHVPLLGRLFCPKLSPFLPSERLYLPQHRSSGRVSISQSFQVKPTFILRLACCLLQFVSLKGSLISLKLTYTRSLVPTNH